MSSRGERAPNDVVVVLSTAPQRAEPGKRGAHELAQALLEERLCACVNVLPSAVSRYWWNGSIDRAEECVLVIKTVASQLQDLLRRLVALHPYEVPEAIALDVVAGHAPYLDWVRAETKPGNPPAKGPVA